MFYIDKLYKHLKWRFIYFAEQRIEALENGVDIVEYNFMKTGMGNSITLVTDLTFEKEQIYNQIQKNGRYEIRRAEREEVLCKLYDYKLSKTCLEEIIKFYNSFVDTKEELTFKLYEDYLQPYIDRESFYCSEAFLGSELSVLHIYYGDQKRIRLWYSASLFRNEFSIERKNSIGRANRYLHWKDICFFKEKGFDCYDWGGYSEEKEKAGISSFKKSFGGVLEKGETFLLPGSMKGKVALSLRNVLKGN